MAEMQLQMVGGGIAVITVITEQFMGWLNKLRKPKTESGILTYAIMIKAVAKFIETGLLLLILSRYIKVDEQVISDGQFNSFSDYWYLTVGSEMVYTFFLSVLALNISPISRYSLTAISRCWDRRCRCSIDSCKE